MAFIFGGSARKNVTQKFPFVATETVESLPQKPIFTHKYQRKLL